MLSILAVVAGLILTLAWFGFGSIGPYLRAGRALPEARRRPNRVVLMRVLQAADCSFRLAQDATWSINSTLTLRNRL
jgi:hypothetical protein